MLPPPPAEKLQNFFGVFLQFQIGVDSNLFNVEPDENEEEINRFLGKFRACSRANQMVLLNMLDFLAEQLLGLQEGNNEDH